MTSDARADAMREFIAADADENLTMVCTDLAARGLDFGRVKVDHVVNFDFPMNSLDYIHRSGRTARAGLRRQSHQPRRQKGPRSRERDRQRRQARPSDRQRHELTRRERSSQEKNPSPTLATSEPAAVRAPSRAPCAIPNLPTAVVAAPRGSPRTTLRVSLPTEVVADLLVTRGRIASHRSAPVATRSLGDRCARWWADRLSEPPARRHSRARRPSPASSVAKRAKTVPPRRSARRPRRRSARARRQSRERVVVRVIQTPSRPSPRMKLLVEPDVAALNAFLTNVNVGDLRRERTGGELQLCVAKRNEARDARGRTGRRDGEGTGMTDDGNASGR